MILPFNKKVYVKGRHWTIGGYANIEDANEASKIAVAERKRLKKGCRIWHIDDVVNEFRASIGLDPIKRNNVQ